MEICDLLNYTFCFLFEYSLISFEIGTSIRTGPQWAAQNTYNWKPWRVIIFP